jgi:ADP-ribose pyrophosphatase
VPLDELVRRVLAGELHNPTLCMGVLAAWTALHGDGVDALRPVDVPWPSREALPA